MRTFVTKLQATSYGENEREIIVCFNSRDSIAKFCKDGSIEMNMSLNSVACDTFKATMVR